MKKFRNEGYWALGAGGFLALTWWVWVDALAIWPLDEVLLWRFQGLQSPALTQVMLAITTLGWWPVAMVLVASTVAVLLWRGHRADALMVALLGVPLALGMALKVLSGRPRPEYLLVDHVPSSLSFPSGHALFAMLFGGLLLFLFEERIRHQGTRRLLQAGVILLIMAVGASRVYLGLHWPSDVIGGYLLGGLSLPVLIWVRNRIHQSRRSFRGRKSRAL